MAKMKDFYPDDELEDVCDEPEDGWYDDLYDEQHETEEKTTEEDAFLNGFNYNKYGELVLP